jgi:hypothetical protein
MRDVLGKRCVWWSTALRRGEFVAREVPKGWVTV